MSKQPPPAPTASTIGTCPTVIQVSRMPRHRKFTQHLRTTQPPRDGIRWDGMGRDGTGQDGRDGMGWDGMGWDGMGWGMGWDGRMDFTSCVHYFSHIRMVGGDYVNEWM